MQNPFESPPPTAGGPQVAGDLDLGLAFREGLTALQNNAVPWVLANMLGGIVILVSLIACLVPALIVGPAIMWGMTRLTLDATRGRAEVGTVWRGFDRLGEAVPSLLVCFLALFVIQIPVIILNVVAGQIVPADEPALVLASTAMQQVVSLAWDALAASRFSLAIFLIVDQGANGVDALTKSWQLTEGRWGQMALLHVGVTICGWLGIAMCCVGVLFTTMIAAGAQASAYDQLTGNRRP